MIQQLLTANRFIPLATDDPDDSDPDTEPTVPCITEKAREDASADSDQSIYFDALEAEDDTPYTYKGPSLPRESSGKLPSPLTFPTSKVSYK